MKDYKGEIQYKGETYKLVFNLNVMETIQAEYGSVDKWAAMTDSGADGEPDAKAVIFGFTEMLNEGIDIANEEGTADEPRAPFTRKQVGRLISDIGLANATKSLNDTVVESTKSEEKNE